MVDRAAKRHGTTLGVIGLSSAVAGFFFAACGVVLGPAAVVLGWLAMGRSLHPAQRILALGSLILGALDTLISLLWVLQ